MNNFYGPGWSGAHYGNWYHGGGYNGFWGGFGAGMLTSWGINSLFNPVYAYSSYGYYPSAWAAPVYSSWGIGSYANSWMYAGYVNPFLTPATQTVVIQQPQPVVVNVEAAQPAPVQPVVAYDYSRPIDTTVAPPEPTAAESAQRVFESARDSFKADDYGSALSLADQALSQLPNDPVIHEFRALALFALRRYDEAAAVNYAVLSSGPGWDWPTLIGLYSSVDAYTSQLRDLESYVGKKPDSAPAQFLLAYFYLAQGDKPAAARRFQIVAKLQPSDTLSSQLAKTLAPSDEQLKMREALTADTPPPAPVPSNASPDQSANGAPSATQAAPPPPPASLQGTGVASPEAKSKITLVIKPDGGFSWAVTQNNRTQTIVGQAGFKDEVLVLGQEEGPPLTGKIIFGSDQRSFSFKPPGTDDKAKGLQFTRETN